ncbi:NAD(P)-dependent glycerol-3-phosphate dehydrogenase [Defluviimonas sp. WL0024]|uniref:Glycerol-3-phosphate dehydrogenase [NAD(P)+] n=2 Tax=Albidovulum TaxID=205889 RepID=A0ABT3J1G4_9RHOB|nr:MULTISPECIES: NAD(P)H-dependent glycerol-3-phosphate dehydrogenase [Defluviimonas]MCU9848043.1 NAD(P)-dependent glycerol-3-phosphate dehydrogenase [Defluviimonas sp. WL0024]MCW3781527.1 NAD(P)-dependent glycerol-3-phosphate dehydrogenase [Defluviimonas salinarum]
MTIAVLGAGAFGTALAVALARHGARVMLWARDADQVARMQADRMNARRLPGVSFPKPLEVTADLAATEAADIVLLAVPMQQTAGLLAAEARRLDGRALVACAKGIDLVSGRGPTAIIAETCPSALPAVLTGPSFAADIARGLPTALTLACADDARGAVLQAALATPVLRLYRSTDCTGAELGGALKNVIAIAAGVVIGAGLGDSARAALMTRGFAEMNRLALALGAQAETLAGLSGFGDLVLTCTSTQSRNFRFGHALGAGEAFDAATTVEGAATAKAVSVLAEKHRLDLPVAAMVAALVDNRISVPDAVSALLSRPLKKE